MPIGTGKVSFATSLVSYFSMFAQLGIPTYGIRACAKVRDNKEELTKTVHELFMINMIMSIISYIVFFVMLASIPKLKEEKILYLIVSLTIIFNTLGMEWLYKALEQYTYITIRSIIFKFIALIAMFILVNEKKDYIVYGGISIFAASASNIMNFINIKKYIYLKPMKNYNFNKHFKAVSIFFAMACATTIYTHLDTVMLGFMTTDEDVGYYNAAIKIKTILVSIVTSLGTVLLPRASYYIEHGNIKQFKHITKKALNFVFLISTPLIIYFILYAKQGIYFLSGESYYNAITPMQIIMPTLLFIGITNILGIQILVPLGKERFVLYSEIAGAITDLIINIILIPVLKASGAALGTLIAEIIVFIVQYYVLKREVKESFKSIAYLKIVIATIIGLVFSYWVVFLNIGNFFSLLLSSILFMGAYLVSLIIMKETLVIDLTNQLLSRLFKKSKKVKL